jgi:hypothetical protein
MKKLQAKISRRSVAALGVTAAVIGLSALAMHAPAQNQHASLKSIQTEKATQLYASLGGLRSMCVELVLPETHEGKAAAANLKVVAQRLDS